MQVKKGEGLGLPRIGSRKTHPMEHKKAGYNRDLKEVQNGGNIARKL